MFMVIIFFADAASTCLVTKKQEMLRLLSLYLFAYHKTLVYLEHHGLQDPVQVQMLFLPYCPSCTAQQNANTRDPAEFSDPIIIINNHPNLEFPE
jgi:hypothetical protein